MSDAVHEVPTSLGARVHTVVTGEGAPVLLLHGAGSTHAEVLGALGPMLPGRRLVVPDLPGHGLSTADGVTSADDAVTALEEVVEATIGDQPYVVVGHSFGGLLARGLAARRPAQTAGMVLICPAVPGDTHPEPLAAVVDDDVAHSLPEAVREEFLGYVVVRTAATADRFRVHVEPSLGRFDGDALGAITEHAEVTSVPADGPYDRPVLVAVGRHDSWVGWRQVRGLVDAYPRASALVVADAGHALPHEQPELLGTALLQWLAASHL